MQLGLNKAIAVTQNRKRIKPPVFLCFYVFVCFYVFLLSVACLVFMGLAACIKTDHGDDYCFTSYYLH